ncbi:DUF2285 domain-containing protein [Inquilinus limosus]|uniref:DNA -binding domain-containing protein n=1 Tax=Inquilinus limosus TaxID=171674 RepID=UPI003F16C256
MLPVRATPERPGADALELAALGCRAAILKGVDGAEHVLLRRGGRAVQLLVRSGTLLAGPVRLTYELSGFESLGAKLTALERLLALTRRRGFPNRLYPSPPRSERWPAALRALELSRAGASQREIAVELFGGVAAAEAWAGPSDFMRSRVRRLLCFADRMTRGGYREVLEGRPITAP